MQKELELLENKELRFKKLDRIDVLEKVGNLLMLPDETSATTTQVSLFFNVGLEAIKSLIKENREELTTNELIVLKGEELKKFKGKFDRSFKDLSKINRELTIFTKRTILNVAMLLRDSEVAKEIRIRLLDVIEEAPKAVKKVTKQIFLEESIFEALTKFKEDDLTVKKFKKIIFENLEKIPFKKRVIVMEHLLCSILEIEKELTFDEITKAYELVSIKNELNEHLAKRTHHSKILMVSKRDKQIKNLTNKVEKIEWKPDFSINLNYQGFSKNYMYTVQQNRLVTSQMYKKWQKHFPGDLLKIGLTKEFYTEPFEWKLGGTLFENHDPTNLVTPLQDQIARVLKRDDKTMFFQGFVRDELNTVADYKKSSIKIYFRLIK